MRFYAVMAALLSSLPAFLIGIPLSGFVLMGGVITVLIHGQARKVGRGLRARWPMPTSGEAGKYTNLTPLLLIVQRAHQISDTSM